MAEDMFHSYDSEASVYDGVTALTGFARVPRRLAKIFNKVAGQLTPGAKVLDFGCGTGRLSVAFKKTQDDLDITGVEPCAMMAVRFTKKFSKEKYPVIHVGYSDGKKLPLTNDQYDAFISTGVFDHIKITPAAMKEFMRVVKPGGYIAFSYERHGKNSIDRKGHGLFQEEYYSHSDTYMRKLVEMAGGSLKHQEKMVGYVWPRFARFGIIVAQKPKDMTTKPGVLKPAFSCDDKPLKSNGGCT